MFFILSKVLFFLLVPFLWVLILLVWMWFTKNQKIKKRLQIITIAILILFTNPFLYQTLSLLWQPEPAQLPSNKTYEAGIILGGLSGYDKNNRAYFSGSADRFIQTANLYHTGIIKRIIVTGGTGSLSQNEPPEATFLHAEFIKNGVPDTAIIIERRSRNTFENAVFTKHITDSLHLQPPFILVTSAQHMRRSVSVFRKAGFSFVPFPCDYKVTPQNISFWDFVPNISLLSEWPSFLKEIVGLSVYKLTGKA